MEEGSGSPESSLRRRWGGLPQGYLALRLWRLSGPPLHQRSRHCTPPNQFSFSSPRALKEEERKHAEERKRRHIWREKHGERKKPTQNNSNMFPIGQI